VSSDRTAHRLTRILSLIPWVLAHPGAKVGDVCERFGCTPEELVKDLNLVFVCGLPGYGPGDLMDAWIDDDEVVVDMADYFARPLRLSAAEALMLLAGGMAVLSSGAAPDALSSAVAKLTKVLAPDEEALSVALASEPDAVAALRKAVAAGDVMQVAYTAIGSGETTERAIEPHLVFSTLGNWYVSAHCRKAGAQRVFRIDRIRSIASTGETFPPVAEAPEPQVRYTPGVDDVTVRLRLGPAARWVVDYYPLEVVGDEGEDVVVDFSTSDPKLAARLVIRLGDAVQIVSGDEVEVAVADLRGRIRARYK